MISGFNHFGLTVSSCDRSIAFYRDVLGFSLLVEAERDAVYTESVTGVSGSELRIVVLEGHGTKLELLEFIKFDDADAIAVSSVGAGHLCFFTPDIQQCYSSLKEQNIDTAGPPVNVMNEPNKGGWVFYARDPDGNSLEFVQSPVKR